MKKSLKLMAATGALAAMCAMPIQAAPVNVNLAINGVPVHADASMGAPFVTDNNRTMIPLRLVGEMVDCTVDYKDGVVTITNDAYDYSAIFKKDATTCTINGETKALDAPMVFTNGRSYVPIRALGESFGTVEWIASSKTVNVVTDMVPQEDPILKAWSYKLSAGSGDRIVVAAHNSKTGQDCTLTVPEDAFGSMFKPENIGEYTIGISKVTNNQATLTIGRNGLMGGSERDVFVAPSLSEGKGGVLEYVGTVPYKTDYAIDSTHIYYTDGADLGPWEVDPRALYVAPLGDTKNAQTYEVDFDINTCKLEVVDGTLIATDANGVAHEVTLLDE